MSNYDMDEIERNESQKQRDQRVHGLDERYSSTEGFGRDDQSNIKNVLRNSPRVQSLVDVLKPVQQWDAQTQSYVQVGDSQDNIRSYMRMRK
jgi:hypothetical protein